MRGGPKSPVLRILPNGTRGNKPAFLPTRPTLYCCGMDNHHGAAPKKANLLYCPDIIGMCHDDEHR